MIPEQEHALGVLESITRPKARNSRETTLLCSIDPCEEFRRLSNEEFCQGWAFSLGTHFADALDIVLQRRMRNKKSYYAWTQSSAFHFRQGYTMYRADGSMALQVQEAKAATPSQSGVIRDAGHVLIQCYTPSNGPTMWEKSSTIAMTQDDFIRFLITGEHTSKG